MKEKKTTITFIVNPISGTNSKDDFPELVAQTLDHDRFDEEVVFTEYAGHAAEIALQRAAEGRDVVVAVGGDGTVNEVARSLTHTNGIGYCPLWFWQRSGPSLATTA